MSDCEEVRPRLAAFLDGEIEEPGPIEEHLSSCPECRKLLGDHEKVSRLASLVPGPSPDPQAWGSVEPRLTTFWGPRSYALVPAAAVALVAVALYLFYFPGGEPRPVGTLARILGDVQLRPLSIGDWVGAPEKSEARLGDTIRTSSGASARVDLVSGGRLFLDRNTEVRFSQQDVPKVKLQLLSGRTCACNCGKFCIEVAGAEITGSESFYVVALENGRPVVYVKSGELSWVKGKERIAGRVEAMQMLDFLGVDGPVPIESIEVFEWAELLSDQAGLEKH